MRRTDIKKIKRELEPSRGFTERTRERYLAAFREAYPQGRRVPWGMYTVRATAGLACIAAAFVLLAAVADRNDVSALSPLYPLKRISESVRLSRASEAEKQVLYADFAQRRIGELESSGTISDAQRESFAAAANSDFKNSLAFLPVSNSASAESERGIRPDAAMPPAPSGTGPTLFSAPAPAAKGTAPLSTSGSTDGIGTFGAASGEAGVPPQPEQLQENASCRMLKGIMENADLRARIMDKELTDLFNAKCIVFPPQR